MAADTDHTDFRSMYIELGGMKQQISNGETNLKELRDEIASARKPNWQAAAVAMTVIGATWWLAISPIQADIKKISESIDRNLTVVQVEIAKNLASVEAKMAAITAEQREYTKDAVYRLTFEVDKRLPKKLSG